MKKRGIGRMVILTIFTLGIYAIYWQCSFQGQLKEETGKGFGAWGHFFMILCTIGIYAIYWQFAAGKRLAMLGATDRSVVYLVFFCCILPAILNPFLMQSQANGLPARAAPVAAA